MLEESMVCPVIKARDITYSTTKIRDGIDDGIFVDGYIKKCFKSSDSSDLAISSLEIYP